MAKSKNPFKLWGSYVGLVASVLLPTLFCFDSCRFFWLFGNMSLNSLSNVLLKIIIPISFGFFAGYGTQLAFRKNMLFGFFAGLASILLRVFYIYIFMLLIGSGQ